MGEAVARRSLLHSTAVMAIGTTLSRLSGFGRIFALGYALGQSSLTDTYNLANNAPNIIYELVLGGVLSATLVPVFVHRFTDEDKRDAWQAISAICTAVFVVLLAVTCLVVVAAPWIIDLYTIGNDDPSLSEQRSVATDLLRTFAPQVAIYGFISTATAILQARRKFGPPMFAPIFNNLVIISMLLALPHVTNDLTLAGIAKDRNALLIMGFGTTAGVLAMGLLLLPYFLNICRGHLRWYWNPRHEAVKSVLKLSGWTAGFVAANQIALWVTLVLANGEPKDVTAFLSAYTFFILPHGIFAVSVISALTPDLSEKWARGDTSGFRLQVVTGIRLIAVIMVPAAVGYAVLSQPIIEVILQHGKFTAADSHRTGEVLMWMVMGLPGFSAFILFTRAFQATQDARSVFYLYLLQNGINVVAALALYGGLGVNGLAIAQSGSYAVAAGMAFWTLGNKTRGLDSTTLARPLLRITAASVVMGLCVYAISTATALPPFATVAAAVIVGAVIYVLTAKLLGVSEVQLVLRLRTRTRTVQPPKD